MKYKWTKQQKERLIEKEKNSFEAFLDEVEIGDCFKENEKEAIQIIELLKKRYRLII